MILKRQSSPSISSSDNSTFFRSYGAISLVALGLMWAGTVKRGFTGLGVSIFGSGSAALSGLTGKPGLTGGGLGAPRPGAVPLPLPAVAGALG